MELLEISRKDLEEYNKKLYDLIIQDYNYDLVIFVAKGAYLIGRDLANFNNAEMIEIFANRSGGKLKKKLSPILKYIPKSVKTLLRKKEFNSNIHAKKSERDIKYNVTKWNKYRENKNILIVDDSIDTGYSIKYVKDEVINFFKNSNVKVAALNRFHKSKNIVDTDFFLFEETMLLGPWSNDSSDNKEYIKDYYKWHERYENNDSKE